MKRGFQATPKNQIPFCEVLAQKLKHIYEHGREINYLNIYLLFRLTP